MKLDEESLLVFSERRKLEILFKKWAKENGIANCPANVLVWLWSKGALNIPKAKMILEEESE